MIIGRDETHDVAAFQEALEDAAKSVVKVSVLTKRQGTHGIATGWQLTDSLVVIPRFLLPERDAREGVEFRCEQGDRTVPARLEFDGGEEGEASDARPALIRLEAPLGGGPLQLASADPGAGDQVLVFQYTNLPTLKFSVGRRLPHDGETLRYDADTAPGSAGGPVLDSDWAVVGMHMSSGSATDAAYNEGLSLTALLDLLREADAWNEIVVQHRLVDVAAMRSAIDEAAAQVTTAVDDLLEAAVRWTIDPDELDRAAAAELEPLVVEPHDNLWTLPTTERIALLHMAPDIDALRRARGNEPLKGIGQAVIDRIILSEPPFKLEDVPEAELPYLLQVARWFEELVPGLPTAHEIQRTLDRRRMRKRLEEIGGGAFRGRADELAKLEAWYEDPDAGPMVISGIGGVGKSALVARFALERPDDALQLWLDFDRPDLAPDDAASVLRVMFEQLATQRADVVKPSIDAATWGAAIPQLRETVAPALAGAPPPLLVLDGFEVAQHAIQHREIWHLLEQVLPVIPGLHVLVSGRAPVGHLLLAGRPAQSLPLAGLPEREAAAWLLENGFEDEAVATRLAQITRGVPLALRLAARWRAEGGDPDELPERGAPRWMIDGFLYDRILDRVVNQRLKPLARDALVLRRVTPDMIPAVLRDTAPDDMSATEVFDALAREMALVGDGTTGHGLDFPRIALPGTGVLQLRPEVRSATLQLLATDNPRRVRKIDERAAIWYAKQDVDDVANAAELVYHRLRLGDVDGAKRAWRDGCAPLLLYAEDDLRPGPARDWLRKRSREPTAGAAEQLLWEQDACDRLQALLLRGGLRSAVAVLDERRERSTGSALVVYDALARHWAGEPEAAAALLDEAEPAEGVTARDREVVRAWLAAQAGDRDDADRRLADLAPPPRWEDRPEPPLDLLTVTAARVRLAIDLHAELDLAELLREADDPERLRVALEVVLPPSDVVMPVLSGQVGTRRGLEYYGTPVEIPSSPEQLEAFTRQVDAARLLDTRGMALEIAEPYEPAGPDQMELLRTVAVAAPTDGGDPDHLKRALSAGVELELLAWRRWRCASRDLFLDEAVTQVVMLLGKSGDPQRMSVLGALAAFAGHERSTFQLVDDKVGELQDVFRRPSEDPGLLLSAPPLPSPERLEFAVRVFGFLGLKLADPFLEPRSAPTPEAVVMLAREAHWQMPEHASLLFLLLTPEPLEMLVRRVTGIPDKLPL